MSAARASKPPSLPPSPFRNYLGIEEVHWRDDTAAAVMRVHERIRDESGAVANGVVFTLLDIVSAEAVRRHVDGTPVRLSTVDMKVIWLGPLCGDAEGTARVLHVADRLAAVEASVVELGTRRPVAQALATFYVAVLGR